MFKLLDNNKYMSSSAIPQKVADMIPCDPAIPLTPGYITTAPESRASDRTLAPYTSIHMSIDKRQKAGNNPEAHGQMSGSTECVYIYSEVFSDIKSRSCHVLNYR